LFKGVSLHDEVIAIST